MTIKNFDGCVAKLRDFRNRLYEQLQAIRGFYNGLPQEWQQRWDSAAEVGGLTLQKLPTPALLEMFKQGQTAISAANGKTDDIRRSVATLVAYQLVISEIGPRLDAVIETAESGNVSDQIETGQSAREEERPDFDEGSDSDYDRAVSEEFVASQTANA